MSLWMRRLWFQVTADRRRVGVLAGCVLVGLLLWARIIIVSNMPRTAVANDGSPNQGLGSTGTPSPAGDVDVSQKTPRISQSVALSTQPGHDPFVISTQYFPKATPVVQLHPDGGKSGGEQAEDSEQIEARRIAHLQDLVGQLRLDAAMAGTMAVISGKAYRPGDEIPVATAPGEHITLTLADVQQRAVILECEGHRFELKMSSPRME